MFKDLLVHVPSTQSSRPVIDCSVSLAASLGAKIDALAFGYEPIVTDLSVDGAAAVVAIMEVQQDRALQRASSALIRFETEAKLMGVRYACRAYNVLPADIGETIGAWSRLRDLTIVSQPEPGRSEFDELVPAAAISNSGGPVMVVPYIHQGQFQARRVTICWDGSRPAARALRDAMPFLEQAESVDVLAVNEEASANEASSSALIAYLARRKVNASTQRLTARRANIHDALLSAASECGATFLVMGAYGHSQLREIVLGGVTRGMLQSMTVPVLMSH